MIHLDTSFLIRALVPKSPEDRAVRAWLEDGTALAMSALAWAEFLCGPLLQVHVELATRIITERIPFLEEDALLAADLFNQAGRRRGSLLDCMIAATALRGGVPLATSNPADFEGFADADLELLSS